MHFTLSNNVEQSEINHDNKLQEGLKANLSKYSYLRHCHHNNDVYHHKHRIDQYIDHFCIGNAGSCHNTVLMQ